MLVQGASTADVYAQEGPNSKGHSLEFPGLLQCVHGRALFRLAKERRQTLQRQRLRVGPLR